MVVTAGAYTAKQHREQGGLGGAFSCLNFKRGNYVVLCDLAGGFPLGRKCSVDTIW